MIISRQYFTYLSKKNIIVPPSSEPTSQDSSDDGSLICAYGVFNNFSENIFELTSYTDLIWASELLYFRKLHFLMRFQLCVCFVPGILGSTLYNEIFRQYPGFKIIFSLCQGCRPCP